MTAGEIARLVGGEIQGDSALRIDRLSKIQEAGPGDITFLANPKYAKFVQKTGASALLISRDAIALAAQRGDAPPLTLIVVDDAYRSFLRLIDLFHPPLAPLTPGVHPSAIISSSAKIGPAVAIGAHVVIEDGCIVGDRVTLHPGVVLYRGVEVGDETVIHANVAIREQCRIGKRGIIHAGTVIGSDGFGFAPTPDGSYEKIPQRGIVVVEDDVEIGANCTIDRATIGETRICKGAKLDNLIQVAHNVVVGENTVMAAQTGISGSTRIGPGCMFGGQAGVAGHLEIAERTILGAKAGVGKNVTEPGKTWFGTPISEVRSAYKTEAALRQLPELLVEFRQLRQRVQELEEQLRQHESPNT